MFILGTANFGNDYPGSPTYVNASAAELIVKEFSNCGGTTLDTAAAYGQSLDIVQDLSRLIPNICTKFSSELMLQPIEFRNYIKNLLNRFKNKLSVIFLHDIIHLHQVPEGSFTILKEFLDKYPNLKFGVSVYYPDEAFKAYDTFGCVSVIQAPLNYFDRRFITDNFKNFCAQRQITINYRSIFLQGKILRPQKHIHPYFERFDQVDQYYSDYQGSNCTSLIEFNIHFVRTVANFSNVILGVESALQIRQIIELIRKADGMQNTYEYSSLEFDEELCIPMKWHLT